ncbi:MAG: cellulase family glycosylhydrolase [Verrucomicrobia bacterium]|nr:cellulase family glycosylhydrolase [Verrucomicrobiota bacterium]
MKQVPLLALLVLLTSCTTTPRNNAPSRDRWTPEQANAWYAGQPWLVGCNFSPSTAINQLEMWQAETWDPVTIDRELGWAGGLGFNSVRVYLHDLAWQQDRHGFLKRMDQFLGIADRHGIGVMFVLFDGVWDPFARPGKQREPYPHRHNSGWVQSPAQEILKNPARQDELKEYVQDVIGRFRTDRRVQVWDLYNEPDNPVPQYRDVELKNKAEMALLLLQKSFLWAREVNPTQPLTSGVWIGNWPDPDKLSPTERVQLEKSDVISFHCYGPIEEAKKCVEHLKRYNRPLLCTEFMARPLGSRFDPVLGYFKEHKVGAYCWGFVDGKTQTIYPWDSWTKQYTGEPDPWFHDILRRDGTPYDAAEVEYIKQLTRAPQRR